MIANKPISIDFREPKNLKELAQYIGIDPFTLSSAIDSSDNRKNYLQHRIIKRNLRNSPKYRIAWEAQDQFLADGYKSFLRRFDLFLRTMDPRYPQPCSYGYVKGCSTIDNASPHCGKRNLLRADISNFFPEISKIRLETFFEKLGISNFASEALARFLTINDTLPLGIAASPMLANMICLDLDDKLMKLAGEYGCEYSRYADDLTFSGDGKLPPTDALSKTIESEGFVLNPRKTRITKLGQAHYVTGLSVSDPRYPRAPKAMKHILRQDLYYCQKYGIDNHISKVGRDPRIQNGVNRIDGTVKYIAHIEKESGPALREKWEALLQRDGCQPSFDPLDKMQKNSVNIYVDETELIFNRQRYLAIGLALIEDVDGVILTTDSICRSYIADPFSGGRKKNIKKKKLHFTDAIEDLRKAYIDKLSILPFRGYVAFARLNCDNEYARTYIKLIKNILPHRLMACDGTCVEIIFEENPKIKQSALEQVVKEIFSNLENINNRRPIVVKTIIGSKVGHSCFSVPDFLLGIFRKFALIETDEVKDKERTKMFFEQLRDRYRVILDVEKNIIYSRKRPFTPFSSQTLQ